jgi:ribosomal protein S13
MSENKNKLVLNYRKKVQGVEKKVQNSYIIKYHLERISLLKKRNLLSANTIKYEKMPNYLIGLKKKKYLSQRERNIEEGRFYLVNTIISLKRRLDLGLQTFLGYGPLKSIRIKARFGENTNRKKHPVDWIKRYAYLESILFYTMYYREHKKGDRDRFSTYVRDFQRSRMKILQKAKSYRAMRHIQFLPVRGQQSKTNAQTQKSKRKNRKKIPIPKKKK